MKVSTPEISWHERDPIYSVDFQPGNHPIQRLASGGVDKIVRIWQMTYDADGKGNVEFLSNLRRHTASINVVRFSKTGELLASAGDDSAILIWKLSDVASPSNNIFSDGDVEEDKETWVCHKTLRGHLGDVQDLSWSKDSRYLVSGSVDNSAIVWDVKKAQKIAFFNDHKSYVQGVAFDPLGDYVASLSSDRSMRIFSLNSKNCVHNVSKMTPVLTDEQQNSQTDAPKPKSCRIFHDDGLRSFFRRLEFSCDGHLLFAPAGCVEVGDKLVNCSFVFVRGAFSRPALYLPSGEKATIVIRANPQLFQLRPPKDFNQESQSEESPAPEWETHKSLFSLPYRVVFAVATDDSVLIYDSQQTMPIALMKNIHYHQISDLSWSPDGNSLIISSTDGFCTIGSFDDGELGIPYSGTSRRRDASSRKPVGVQDNSPSNIEESSEKPTSSALPFSRYTDVKSKHDQEKEKKNEVPEINTKLNIRRVEVKKSSDKSAAVTDNKEKEKTCAEISPTVNTSLNIRKVKKSSETSPVVDKKKEKETKTNKMGDAGNVEMKNENPGNKKSCNSKEDASVTNKINTTLNIRKVKKEEKASIVNKKEEVKDQNILTVRVEDVEMKEEDGKDITMLNKNVVSEGEKPETVSVVEKEQVLDRIKSDDVELSNSVKKIDIIEDVEMEDGSVENRNDDNSCENEKESAGEKSSSSNIPSKEGKKRIQFTTLSPAK